jgi:hypothetical protein
MAGHAVVLFGEVCAGLSNTSDGHQRGGQHEMTHQNLLEIKDNAKVYAQAAIFFKAFRKG